MPDQVVDLLFDALHTGAPFYIICRDDEMSDAKMNAGIQVRPPAADMLCYA